MKESTVGPIEGWAQAECGITNTETGEFKRGYYNRKAKTWIYRNPLPWYKRIFGKKEIHSLWDEPEHLWSRNYYIKWTGQGIFDAGKDYGTSQHAEHLYREKHLYTGKFRYFIMRDGQRYCYIDPKAYEQHNAVVVL